MQIILEPYAVPERGTFQIQQTITIRISANEAMRQVDNWLLHEVSSQMGAGQPALVVGERSVWRVPVYWSTPPVGRIDTVGSVEVDLLSGEMDNSAQHKAELIQHAQELAVGLPPFQLREAPEAYLAKQVPTTHRPGRPDSNPRDLIS